MPRPAARWGTLPGIRPAIPPCPVRGPPLAPAKAIPCITCQGPFPIPSKKRGRVGGKFSVTIRLSVPPESDVCKRKPKREEQLTRLEQQRWPPGGQMQNATRLVRSFKEACMFRSVNTAVGTHREFTTEWQRLGLLWRTSFPSPENIKTKQEGRKSPEPHKNKCHLWLDKLIKAVHNRKYY